MFYENEAEEKVARETVAKIEKQRGEPVRTAIRKAQRFYVAEDYHQKYALRGDGRLFRDVRALFATDREFVESTVAARVNAYLGGHVSFDKLKVELAGLGLEAVGERSLERVRPAPKKPASRPTTRESARDASEKPTSRSTPSGSR